MTLIIPLLAILLLYAVSLLREIMSVAFPGSVTLHVAPHVRPHPQFLPLMNAGSTALRALGFAPLLSAEIRVTPAYFITAKPARYYISADRLTLAVLLPALEPESAATTQVNLYSRTADGIILATTNNPANTAFDSPERSWGTAFPDIGTQYLAHQNFLIAQDIAAWPDDPAAVFKLMQAHESSEIDRLYTTARLRRQADGSGRLTLPAALHLIKHLLRHPVPPPDARAVPSERLALLREIRRARRAYGSLPNRAAWGLFLIPAVLFLLGGALLWTPLDAALLLVVIALHEGGHWLAMRLCGYRHVHIVFLPFIGGITVGEEQHAAAHRRAWIALFGPLPGLVLAAILSLGGVAALHPALTLFTTQLLLINLFNLLPVLPLDGGRILQALLPRSGIWVTLVFCVLSTLMLLALAWLLHDYFLVVIACFPALQIKTLLHEYRLQRQWQALPPPQNAWQETTRVIRLIQRNSNKMLTPAALLNQADALLNRNQGRPASPAVTLCILTCWLGCFAALLLPPLPDILRGLAVLLQLRTGIGIGL